MIKATHACMTTRGVHKHGVEMVTRPHAWLLPRQPGFAAGVHGWAESLNLVLGRAVRHGDRPFRRRAVTACCIPTRRSLQLSGVPMRPLVKLVSIATALPP